MNINLEEFLPKSVSDETAGHIANFMKELALAVDSHYFAQMMRRCKKNREARYKNSCQSDPF